MSIDIDPLEQLRGDVPALSVVGDDADGLPVVAGHHAGHRRAACRVKPHALADPELEHGDVRLELPEEPEPRDDSVVEVDQLGLGQSVDVYRHFGSFELGWGGSALAR